MWCYCYQDVLALSERVVSPPILVPILTTHFNACETRRGDAVGEPYVYDRVLEDREVVVLPLIHRVGLAYECVGAGLATHVSSL